MSEADFALLQPHFEPVELPIHHVLAAANVPIEHAYFLEYGVTSVVAVRADGSRIEVGIYGREGMGGFAWLLGSDRMPHENFMQIAGAGHRIKAEALVDAVRKSDTLNELLCRFVHVFLSQTACKRRVSH